MKELVCIVEDDPTIGSLIKARLEDFSYQVTLCESAEVVMEKTAPWDLFIVDVLLAGEATGLDLCRFLRERSPTLPVLVLSALSEPSDRLEGLRAGADDYLTKPFEMEELLLRVKGAIRN